MKPREFFKRWGEGIQMITPLQLTFQQLIGQTIVLFGIVIGLYVTFVNKQWWIFVILIGSLIVAGTSMIGVIQKYKILKMYSMPIQKEEMKTTKKEERKDGYIG